MGCTATQAQAYLHTLFVFLGGFSLDSSSAVGNRIEILFWKMKTNILDAFGTVYGRPKGIRSNVPKLNILFTHTNYNFLSLSDYLKLSVAQTQTSTNSMEL